MPEKRPNSIVPFPSGRRPALAEERLADCLVMDEMRARRWRGQGIAFRYGGQTFRTLGQLAKYLAARAGKSVTSIWRWLALFDAAVRAGQDVLTALSDRRRSDKGRSRFFDAHPIAAAWVRARSSRKPRSTARAIHKALLREWPALEGKSKQPSYATLLEFVKLLWRERLAARQAKRTA